MSVETHRWAPDVNHTSQSFPRVAKTQSIEEALSFLFGYEAGSLQLPKIENLPAVQETQVQSLSWEDPWRRKWQPFPVFLPRKSLVHRSLVGYSPWGSQEIGHDLATTPLPQCCMIHAGWVCGCRALNMEGQLWSYIQIFKGEGLDPPLNSIQFKGTHKKLFHHFPLPKTDMGSVAHMSKLLMR